MLSQLSRAGGACALGFVLAAAAQIASADVTTQQRISIDGLGGMKIANMSGTTTTIISGERSRTESDLQLQSKLIRMFARGAGGAQVDIVRLDQERIEHLDLAKKEYSETTFAQLREQLQKATATAAPAPGTDEPKPTNVDDSKCEWSDPKAEVKRTGEKASIAGYDAERLTITASQACKDKDSGQVCEFVLSLDEWLAPKFASSAEVQKFHRAYAQKMGLGTGIGTDAQSKDIAERAQGMFGRYKGIWGEIASKMKGVKGYPVKTSFAFAVGGAQCQSAQSSSSGSADATSGDSAKSPAALAGQIGGKLAGLFHKKSDAPAPADAAPDASANAAPAAAAPPAAAPLPEGMTPIITMTSELVSVSTDAVDPGVFEIPAGFKKVEK
jgi:hypothetical protein